MRAVIFGNGTITDYGFIENQLDKSDFIICADGGLKHAKRLNIKADLLIGDFDSSVPDEHWSKNIIVYPVRKDFTDGELCMKYASDNNFDEVALFGMTGSRLDHTLNNILLLFRHKNSCLVNENNIIFPFTQSFSIQNKKGLYLSIIPLDGDLEGLYASGLEYPLNNDTLKFGTTRGNSNVITDDNVTITAKKGKGIIVIANGPDLS